MAPVTYWVDETDRLIRVNEAWDRFAQENEAPELSAARVVDRSLWAFIADEPTRQIYGSLLRRVREGATACFSLRCDSPTTRRQLELQVSPAERDLVCFRGVVTKVESRPEQRLLMRSVPRSADLLTICAWCKKVRVPSGWAEVEDAVVQLALFDLEAMPQLTHGICPRCAEGVESVLKDAVLKDAVGRVPSLMGRRGRLA